jgi:hypothetical protein
LVEEQPDLFKAIHLPPGSNIPSIVRVNRNIKHTFKQSFFKPTPQVMKLHSIKTPASRSTDSHEIQRKSVQLPSSVKQTLLPQLASLRIS